MMIPEHINSLHNQSRLLYSMSEVGTAVSRMAAEITQKLSTSCPWVMPVMNGGLIPAGLLLQQLDFPLQLDYLHATRYGQGTSGGKLVWKVFPGEHLAGQTVLLIDDILDKGQTLANVVEACRQQGAVAVYSAAQGGLDPMTKMLEGMGLALVTTFYGVLFSNLLFIPIAGKLKTLSDEEMWINDIIMSGVVSLHQGDSPQRMKENLLTFVSRGLKQKISAPVRDASDE